MWEVCLSTMCDGLRDRGNNNNNKYSTPEVGFRHLDYFVMFSSVSAMWGQPAQPCYSAANSVLDNLAERRRRSGVNAISIQLGAVRGAGFLEWNRATLKLQEAKGMKSLHVS